VLRGQSRRVWMCSWAMLKPFAYQALGINVEEE
jgi:hypothetical protein